jgi:N-acetylneuraminic acid mutarotase
MRPRTIAAHPAAAVRLPPSRLAMAALLVLAGHGVAAAQSDWPPLEWRKAAPSPIARTEAATAVVGGKLYLFGGFIAGLETSAQVDIYDPTTDTWSRGNDMPTRPTHENAAVDGTVVWIAGGFLGRHPGPATAEVWKYDTVTDAWTAGPPLPEPRAGGGLAVVAGRLHYFGGFKPDRDTVCGDHWSLPLREQGAIWTREPDMPNPRGHLAAAALGGKVYALGGANGHDRKQVDQPHCDSYDPATKAWTSMASLPDGRSHFEGSTIVHEGRIIVVSGRCNASQPPRMNVDDMLVYDPRADAWRVLGTNPLRVMAPSAEIVGGKLVVIAGGVGKPLPLTADAFVAEVPKR